MSLTNDAVFLSLDKGGLCNRLMPLAGVGAVAHENQLPFYWQWKANHVCPGEFESCLFGAYGVRLDQDTFVETIDSFTDPVHFNKGSNRGLSCTQHWRYYHHWSPLDRDAHFEKGLSKLREIKPVGRIATKISSLGIEPNTVGVHIRRTDFESKYGDSWVAAENKKLRQRLESLVSDSYSFFVAADSERALRIASSVIPENRLLSFGHKYQSKKRRRHTGMEAAVLDLFALSRCGFIIGTNNSSFSICAGAIGDKTVEYVYG